MASSDGDYLNDMRTAAGMNEAAEDTADYAIRHQSIVLYSVSSSYLSVDAKSLAPTFEDCDNGFEFCRTLAKEMEPNSGIRKLALRSRIEKAELLKGKSEEQFASAVRAWEKESEQYNKTPCVIGGAARYDEHKQIGVLLESAPTRMRIHLQTGQAIRSYADLRERVQAYLEDKGAWNLGDGAVATPMEVDAIGKGKGEGDGCYRCGDKNHMAKECHHADKVCHKCGKTGHLGKMCMSQSSDKGKGDGKNGKFDKFGKSYQAGGKGDRAEDGSCQH